MEDFFLLCILSSKVLCCSKTVALIFVVRTISEVRQRLWSTKLSGLLALEMPTIFLSVEKEVVDGGRGVSD